MINERPEFAVEFMNALMGKSLKIENADDVKNES
jgi:hypothetical protein